MNAYSYAKEKYAEIGVDTDKALDALKKITISLHCWQGDDVGGFEADGQVLSGGGIQTTGNYPGKARNIAELRQDFEKALSLIGGPHKLNLHAIYLENGGTFVDRDAIEPKHFSGWVDFAKKNNIGLDFNPTYFSHPLASDGYTISSADKSVREFWIEHGKRCRIIAEYFGKELGQRCVTNFWMCDGIKEDPVDRIAPRERMKESLDEIFSYPIDINMNRDAFESKLFGIGSESYVVASHEFVLGYTGHNRNVIPTLDTGHFHPTERVSDKISSLALFYDELLLHVSRPVRWDSDHVVVLDDELRLLAHEIISGNLLGKINIALDYFDASINRIAAWVLGVRCTQKALLAALLEPVDAMKKAELDGDTTSRLVTREDLKTMPFGEVWNEFCDRCNIPADGKWLGEIKTYENEVLSKR